MAALIVSIEARAQSVYVTLDDVLLQVPGFVDSLGRPVVRVSKKKPVPLPWPDGPHWDSLQKQLGYDPRNFTLDRNLGAVIQQN